MTPVLIGANAHVRPGSLVNVFDTAQLKKTAESTIEWRPLFGRDGKDYITAGTLGIVLAIEKIGSNKDGFAFFLLVNGRLGWVINYDVVEEAHGDDRV